MESWVDRASDFDRDRERAKPTSSPPTDSRDRFPSYNERDRYAPLLNSSYGSMLIHFFYYNRRDRDRDRGVRDRPPPPAPYSRPPPPLGATNYNPHDRDRERWANDRYQNDR